MSRPAIAWVVREGQVKGEGRYQGPFKDGDPANWGLRRRHAHRFTADGREAAAEWAKVFGNDRVVKIVAKPKPAPPADVLERAAEAARSAVWPSFPFEDRDHWRMVAKAVLDAAGNAQASLWISKYNIVAAEVAELRAKLDKVREALK